MSDCIHVWKPNRKRDGSLDLRANRQLWREPHVIATCQDCNTRTWFTAAQWKAMRFTGDLGLKVAAESHDKIEYEFKAQRVLDVVRSEFGDAIGFACVFDYGSGGHIGYASTAERTDVVRMITEWLGNTIGGFGPEQLRETLELLEQERGK